MLVNRKAVRQLSLDCSTKYRSGKFTRVSKSFLEKIDHAVRQAVEIEVKSHPSIGKTLMGGGR
jgi:hypothetical protein